MNTMVTRSTTSRVTRPTTSAVTGNGVSGGSPVVSQPWDNTFYLLATGQSNMLSRDDADQATTSVAGVSIINSVAGTLETWDLTTATPQHLISDPGVGSTGAEANHDSLAFYFAKLLKESTGKNVVVIFVAWGGTALEHFLSPSGAMYAEIVDQIETSTGIYVPRIDLHIHHQGEANNNDAGFATDLTDFRASMEALDKYPATCPMIMGEVFDKLDYDDINAALASFASGDADVHLASSDSLTSIGDDVHFDSASLQTLASRMYAFVDAAMLETIYTNATGSGPSGTISDLAANGSAGKIDLTWTDVADASIVAYIIERDAGSGYSELSRVAPGVEAYTDSGLGRNESYSYRVKALNAYGVTISNAVTESTPDEFAPIYLNNLELWLDATDEDTVLTTLSPDVPATNGQAVRRLIDKSYNARHANQTSGTAQPLFQTAVVNGLSAIRFDGSNDAMSCGTAGDFNFLHDGTVALVVAVMKIGTTANPNATYYLFGTARQSAEVGAQVRYNDSTSTDNLTLFVERGVNGVRAVDSQEANAVTPNQYLLLELDVDADNATASERNKFRVNGGSEVGTNTLTNAPSVADSTSNLFIGTTSNGILPFNGDLCELIICSNPNTANRTALRSYVASKYGIAIP